MKIALISPVIVKNDAVSNIVRDKYFALKKLKDVEITTYCYNNHYDWEKTIKINSSIELLYRNFLSHDIYIFEWAIYYEFISYMRLIKAIDQKRNAKIVVHFHNFTPLELVNESVRKNIQLSYEQFALFDLADQIWSTSEFNKIELINYGIDESKISLLSPAIQFKDDCPLSVSELMNHKEGLIVNLLYVGRFVQSKGILDLIEAVNYAVNKGLVNIKLNLVGAAIFSDQEHLTEIKNLINHYKLEKYINIILDASEAVLKNLFKISHIFITASHHEGFCVPVIEALYYGCFVIAYDNSNLPYLLNNLGALVENRNKELLAKTLFKAVKVFSQTDKLKDIPVALLGNFFTYKNFLKRTTHYASQFTYNNFENQLNHLLQDLERIPMSV